MRTYFLDTNIILDFLSKRPPFHRNCLELFKKGMVGEFTLVTTDNAITTVYFILKKHLGKKNALDLIKSLLQYLEIESVGKNELQSAFDVNFNDYEDAVQYCTALKNGKIDAIITRNKKDFKNSNIRVLGPDEIEF